MSSPAEKTNAEAKQLGRLKGRNYQTAGVSTKTSLPKFRPAKVTSPGLFNYSSDVLQPGGRVMNKRASNNEDLTIPHTREIPPSSTHRSSLEIGKANQ